MISIIYWYVNFWSCIEYRTFELDKFVRKKREPFQRYDGPVKYKLHSVFLRLFPRVLGLPAVFGEILEIVERHDNASSEK